MSVSEDDHTTPEELTALCERGVHFVLCRAADDGPKKAKSAIKSRWQTKAAARCPRFNALPAADESGQE